MGKKKNQSFDEKRHLLNTYSPTFLAACNLINLVPSNQQQFICPFCGNGSGENGTGVTFDFIKENGEYAYHCFRCQETFDNVAIAQKVLGLAFMASIREALNVINGKVAFDGVQPEYATAENITPKDNEPPKDYSKAYEIWEAKLIYLLENGKYQYRGLTLQTLQHFKVGYANDWGEPPTPRIIIPYNKNHYIARFYGSDEMLRDPKYKGISLKHHSRGIKPIFGLDAVIKARQADEKKLAEVEKARKKAFESRHDKFVSTTPTTECGKPIFVVEGEIDAMSGYQLTEGEYSFIGLGGCEITKTVRDSLKANEKFPSSVFIVLLDNDKAGNAAKAKVAQALIELGHYAIIGNLAKFKTYYSKSTKIKENGKTYRWDYGTDFEMMPLEGYNRKHCKDLNDTITLGVWTEARKILYYLAEMANLLGATFGSFEDFLVRDYRDLHNKKEQNFLEIAHMLHTLAAEEVKEKYDFDIDDNFFDLFEVPTENAHIKFKNLNSLFKTLANTLNSEDGTVTQTEKLYPLVMKTAPMQYLPYWVEGSLDEEGNYISKIKTEFLPPECLPPPENPQDNEDEFTDAFEREESERKMAESNADNVNQDETAESSSEGKTVEEKSTDESKSEAMDLASMKNFQPMSAGETKGDVNPEGYGSNNPEDQPPPPSSSDHKPKKQGGNSSDGTNGANWTQEAIESCPINLKVPVLYYFMDIGIKNRDSGDMFSRVPVVPTKTLVNVDTGIYSTELAFLDKRIDTWKFITVEDRIIADSNELVKLTSNGLVSTKKQARTLSNYLLEIRDLNQMEIPREELYSSPGWTDDKCKEFLYPGIPVNGKVLKVQGEFLRDKFGTKGDFEDWKKRVLKLLTWTIGDDIPLGVLFFLFGAALSAPVLRIVGARNAQYLLWCQTGSGKSALVKMLMSVYGRPEGLKNTFNGTFNSLYDLPKNFNDMPVHIDEFQSASRVLREQMSQFIYGYELGKTRLRLDKNSAMRQLDEYKGVRFMTGEQPMLSSSVDAGAMNRLLSISSRQLFPIEYDLGEHHNFFDDNFGFFGPVWTEHLAKSAVQDELKRLYKENCELMQEISRTHNWTNNWANCFATVLTSLQIGLPLLDQTIYPEWIKMRFLRSIDAFLNDIPKTTTFTNSERALSALEEYIVAHPRNFLVETTRINEERRYKYTQMIASDAGNAFQEQGYLFKDGSVGIIQTEIKNILEKELGFGSYESILRGWRDEGKIVVKDDSNRHQFTTVKRMPKPFSQTRRLVLFPPNTLEVEIVPHYGKYEVDKDIRDDDSDEDEE